MQSESLPWNILLRNSIKVSKTLRSPKRNSALSRSVVGTASSFSQLGQRLISPLQELQRGGLEPPAGESLPIKSSHAIARFRNVRTAPSLLRASQMTPAAGPQPSSQARPPHAGARAK